MILMGDKSDSHYVVLQFCNQSVTDLIELISKRNGDVSSRVCYVILHKVSFYCWNPSSGNSAVILDCQRANLKYQLKLGQDYCQFHYPCHHNHNKICRNQWKCQEKLLTMYQCISGCSFLRCVFENSLFFFTFWCINHSTWISRK